ncbi:uncharacterized protein LOC141914310 [Tubulanus polymorphus]|uniref:uncharacterized protein LOC141914310 n=1 Tax=Tubulanus polymorphus TaxID=672921 RepID=UPI003DA1EF80
MSATSRLTDEQMDALREAFQQFDQNRDGHIDANELINIIQMLGRNPTKAEVHKMIRDVDKDGNQTIEFGEFVEMMEPKMNQWENHAKDLRKAFSEFDKNNDGFIDKHELKTIMGQIGEKLTDEDVEEMIKEADVDSDGRVNYDEFVKMMTSKEF